MMTFCFINAASWYHASPVKQRAVRKHSKGGIATQGAFPSFTDEKAPERLRFRGHDKIKKSVVLRREYNPSLKGYN